MANWQATLNIKEPWEEAKVGKISHRVLAKRISEKLRELQPFLDPDLEDARSELADDFETLSEDPTASVKDFDYIMDALYDWGDIKLDEKWPGKKACWVATF